MRVLIFLAVVVASWVPATRSPAPALPWLPGPFSKSSQPILRPEMDAANQATVAVLGVDGRYHLLYDSGGLLFLAESDDGLRFQAQSAPVFGPTEWYEKAGVEDPRLVFVDNLYYLTYTGYEGNLAHLCLATSPDLKAWKKHGPMFAQFPANARRRYPDNWTRAGAILDQKIRGRWWMVFGDSDLWLATSDDLLTWNYRPEPLLRPESGLQRLEAGPPPIRRKEGIVVFYNATDAQDRTSVRALLLSDYDLSVLERAEGPVLEATQAWERGTTQGSALLFDGHYWSLYYAGAAQAIGVARAGR